MRSLRNLTNNPFILFFYVVVGLILVSNIFIAGYWFGRNREFSEHFLTPNAQASSTSQR